MNVKSILLASAVMAATSVSAATFSPGEKWNSLPSADAGSGMVIPFEYGIQYGATQTIFSIDEIGKLSPVTAADGSTTVNKITSVSFPIYIEGGNGAMGTAEFKAFLTPYDGNEFTKDGNDYMWASYDGEGTVSGTVSIDGETDDDLAMAVYGGDYYVTITFDQPYECDGKSILFTLLFDNQLEDAYYMDWYLGTYSVNPNKDVKRVRSGCKTGNHNLTGKIPSTHATIPVVNFTYETEVKEAEAGGEVVGDPTVLNIGNWDDPKVGSESVGAKMPCDPGAYSNGFAQAIYTADQLVGLYTVGADGITTSDITSLTYKLMVEGYLSGSFHAKVYIENTDLTTLPVVDSKYQWVAYNKDHMGEVAEMTYEYDELYEPLDLKAEFANPLRYEGKSLLVTWVTDGFLDEYGMGVTVSSQVMLGQKGQSAIKCADSALDNLTGNADNVGNDLPVLQLGITPITTKPVSKPVTFANVMPSLRKVTVNPSIIGWGGLKEANALCVSFDLVDEATDGSYVIKLGNTVLGEINGTHGEISYIAKPTADLYLTVEPKAEGAIGTSYSVALADVDALFPAPEVTTGETAMFTAYDAYSRYDGNKATITGAASFKFSSEIPVVKMAVEGYDYAKVITATNCPDQFEDFLPVGDYSDYAANNGKVTLFRENLKEVAVLHGELDPSESLNNLSIKGKFSINVDLVSSAKPALAAALAEDATYDVNAKGDFTVSTVKIAYNNGTNYESSSLSANVDPETLVEEVTFPDKLVYKIDTKNDYVDFFAPAGMTIHYCFVPEEAGDDTPSEIALMADAVEVPELDWISTDNNKFYHATTEAGTIHVKTQTADGETPHYLSVTIDKQGTVAGVDNVAFDNANAPAVYYNLQGQRVANPANGIFIRVEGTTATKVAL